MVFIVVRQVGPCALSFAYPKSLHLRNQLILGLSRPISGGIEVRAPTPDPIKEKENKMTVTKTYQNAIAALNSLQSNAQTIERARKERDQNATKNIPWITKLLRYVDVEVSDLDNLNVIHVSGTKGKGSTCAFTESLLRNSGYRTGFFSSPHLVSVRERIRLCGKPIAEQLFTQYFWEVYDKLSEKCSPEETPPYFKFLTVMSFYVFLKEKVDVAVVEVGIGGMYDSTNVIAKPVVCGVTSLGYDHMSLLGETLPQITSHKAGIFKRNCPAVTVSQPEEAFPVLANYAKEIGAALFTIPSLEMYPTESGPVCLGLEGRIQSVNASLALQLFHIWVNRQRNPDFLPASINSRLAPFMIDAVLQHALESCSWPGRFQRITYKNIDFFLDGAHTKESVRYCAEWYRNVSNSRPEVRRFLLFNSTADRNPQDLLTPLVDCDFQKAFFCPNILDKEIKSTSDLANFTVNPVQQSVRSLLHADVWKQLDKKGNCQIKCFDSVRDAFDWIASFKVESVEVLVTGSLHLVGAALTILDPSLNHSL